jgi:hypothetical protein
MENTLTVAELIAVLSRMPQDMTVRMGMNMEYEAGVTADMVEVFTTHEGEQFVYITDTPSADYEDDGQPTEMEEWHSFDPDC